MEALRSAQEATAQEERMRQILAQAGEQLNLEIGARVCASAAAADARSRLDGAMWECKAVHEECARLRVCAANSTDD